MNKREFKFRGWINGKMRYGIKPGACCDAEWVTGESGGSFNWDDAPLMQYTGLKDKNGEEIYEGDLVLFSGNPNGCGKKDSTPLEVYIHMPTGVRLICEANGGWHYDWIKMASSWDEVEIVGNIWKNKTVTP